MSIIKEKLRKQAANFTSLRETLELLTIGDECALEDAALFMLRAVLLDRKGMPRCAEHDGITGWSIKGRTDLVLALLNKIASDGVFPDEHKNGLILPGCDRFGWKRDELTRYLSEHGIHLDEGSRPNPVSTEETTQHHLCQLEAENARLAERVADLETELSDATEEVKYSQRRLVEVFEQRDELQRQLQEVTAAPQQSPQQAIAAPQDDEGKPLHPKRETTYLNTIGALVELIQAPRPGRDSEAAVIREILDNYSERPGISKRTLEGLFPEAKKRVQSI